MGDKVIMKLEANYADEFDVDSVYVTTRENAERIKKRINDAVKKDKYVEYCFGSNESLLLQGAKISIKPISDEFYKEFKKVINSDGSFGLIDLANIEEFIDDDFDEDFEDDEESLDEIDKEFFDGEDDDEDGNDEVFYRDWDEK